VTGPTTAAELLHLAASEVQDLLDFTERYRPDPAGLAAGWPAFLRAAQHLNSAIRPDHPGGWALTARLYGLVTGPVPADRPDPHLERAATLLAAAADLIGSRDRRGLSPEQLRADEAHVAPTLVAVAHLVAQATLHHPDVQPAFASAFGAVSAWSCSLPGWGQSGQESGSLRDASTLVSRPTPTLGDLPGLLEVAVHDWQWAALTAAARAAPSSDDLQRTARTAGGLLALSQVLLWAHTDTSPTAEDSAVRTIIALRAAGTQWKSAVGNWRSITTAIPASQDLLLAGVAVDTTIRLLGRTEDRWASAQDVRGRADRTAALAAARGALAAVQAVAEQHTPLVSRLAQGGDLYAPARQLTPGEDRITARMNNKWIQLGKTESSALTEAYRRLPAVTATARALFTAVTSPHASLQAPAPAVTGTGRQAGRNTQPRWSDRTQPIADPATVRATTLSGQTWHRTCTELDPRLTSDPHYPVLAAALDRIALAGVNVTAALAEATAGAPLPPEHTARALHYQLLDVCPAAVIPYADVFTARAAPSRPGPPPTPVRPQTAPVRSGPAR